VALTPDGRTLLVTLYDGAIVFVDTSSDRVIANHEHRLAASQWHCHLTRWYTRICRQLLQYRRADLRCRHCFADYRWKVFSTSAYPKSVFLTPDGSQLWVLSYRSFGVTIIDTLSLTISGGINTGGQADIGMAFDPSGTRAYIGTGKPTDGGRHRYSGRSPRA